MSEQRLRELGREAPDLVDLPDLGSLERRGRALRLRRQVGVVAAAVLVASTGAFLFQDRSQEPQPAPPPGQPTVQPYPGPLMTTLAVGTYSLTPALDGDEPTALVTVPGGWNSWQGPNRFDGHRQGESDNSAALARSTWTVGVLVLKVLAVATAPCQTSVDGSGGALDYQGTVEGFSRLPGYVSQVVGEERFDSHPATHLRLEPEASQQACDREARLYRTETNGVLGTRGALDVWVVDVDGTTLTVVAYARGEVPPRFQDELAQVTDSITFAPAG